MKIQSIIKREGGTTITLDKNSYHFAPDKSGAHVCDVEDKSHAQKFLGITEGYKIYGDADPAVIKEDPPEEVFDPEAMNNKDLEKWARTLDINPRSKESIEEYGAKTFEVDLDKRESATSMLRELARLQKAADEDESSDDDDA